MSASDDIKDAIVNYFDCTDVKGNKAADWKRRDKRTLASGHDFREFHNAKLNRTVYTLGDDEDCQILEKDQWIYGFSDAADLGEDGSFVLSFEPLDRFLRCARLYDQHQQDGLVALMGLPANLDEVCENQFIASHNDYNELTIHMTLKKAGFKFSRELTDWLMAHKAPTTPAPGPDLSIVPAVLDPNYSAPLQPASSSPAPAASGVITKFANKNPGQVAAAAQATHQAQQASMMAAIGQMAGQLGATGGVQIGSTHIPATPAANPMAQLNKILAAQGTKVVGVGPGGTMTPLNGIPPLPPSGLFNSPGMQAAMPIMSGGYPELVNLQPAVQAAFISQRIMGHMGLDQANTAWDDDAAINAQFQSGVDEIEIERSHAIWLLYEIYDDGSSNPLIDFFLSDDEELSEHLGAVLDMDEDDQYISIRDDDQAYPAPYDLPVPQPAPYVAPPMPPGFGGGGRAAPMVGPASMNARAGSFAPLPAAPPAVVPPAPPVGAASAYINSDSGDKWAEFCGEVWNTFSANKANLPLDLTWSDRYRPRDAQITGLGYKFVRREFTGIVMQMGYLDREGNLLETIDLPGDVLSEVLKEWGGDWNIDDITQMIHKRKGENPETGFSYSSEGLFDEVKAYLDGEGWKEA